VRPSQPPADSLIHLKSRWLQERRCECWVEHCTSSLCQLLLLLSVLLQLSDNQRIDVGDCYVPSHGLPSSPGKQSRTIWAFAILVHQIDGFFDGWHLGPFYSPLDDVIVMAVSLMSRCTAATGKPSHMGTCVAHMPWIRV